MGGLGGDEVVERIDGGGEEHGVAALAGLVAQGGPKWDFPRPHGPSRMTLVFF